MPEKMLLILRQQYLDLIKRLERELVEARGKLQSVDERIAQQDKQEVVSHE